LRQFFDADHVLAGHWGINEEFEWLAREEQHKLLVAAAATCGLPSQGKRLPGG
jgi:hypothetical protein